LDMFFSVMLGFNPHTTESAMNHNSSRDNKVEIKFKEMAMTSLRLILHYTRNPHLLAERKKDPQWAEFTTAMDCVYEFGKKLLQTTLERMKEKEKKKQKDKTDDDDDHVPSYFEKLIQRNEMSETELVDNFSTFLFAGVDTTHHLLLWILLNLARFPEKQEILYQELTTYLPNQDDELTSEILRNCKYLNYVIRESHRFTTTSPATTSRRLSKPIEILGYHIPAGTTIYFCANAVQNDPRFIDHPDQFIPERWSPEEVEKRNGTIQEVIDHKILAEPFGFGPRMCIGARIAKMEIKTFLIQLMRDWKITFEPTDQIYKISSTKGVFTTADPYPTLKFEPRKKE